MAMTLNLTLAIQIAHFFIAYFLLSKFLFRPAYEFYKAEENRTRQLKRAIIREQDKLAEKQDYKRKRWQHCQNYFQQHRPNIDPEAYGIQTTKGLEPTPHLSPEEFESLAITISSILKERVLND